MSRDKKVFGLYGVSVFLLAVLAATLTQLAAAQESGVFEAIYRARGNSFTGPDQLPAGFVNITLENGGESGYTLVLLRLKEGSTVEEVVSAVEAVDRAFAQGGDASAAINETLELASIVGDAFAEPGTSYRLGTTLEAGRYIAYGTAESAEEDAPRVNTHRTLEVTGKPQAEAPEADQTVQMVDFAFAFPPDIQAGKQTWKVVNNGQQVHHLVLLKLHEGKTMDDVMAWMENEEGPPPADEAGHVGSMSAGEENFVDFNLTPGDYVAICFMPDHAEDGDGAPHFVHGMMQSFTVAGE